MSPPVQNVDELIKAGRIADAIALLSEIVRKDPDGEHALRRLAGLLLKTGRAAEAAEIYSRLVASGTAVAHDHQELALYYAGRGKLGPAVEQFRAALAKDPRYVPAHCNLGLVLEDLGRQAEAVESLRQALKLAGKQPLIEYHLAALGGAAPPPACPDEYLIQLFNDYAPRFEQHLVNELGYRGPQLLLEALRPLLPAQPIDVIDLGCGTGLCGRLFRGLARRIVGVDLSPVMLDLARQSGSYDELVRCDLVAALLRAPRSANVILAADVFIYVGELSRVFHAAHTALRPGGLFAFTLETTAHGNYMLGRSRRYAHSLAYIRQTACAAGFRECSATSSFLRAGEEGPVAGSVVVLAPT